MRQNTTYKFCLLIPLLLIVTILLFGACNKDSAKSNVITTLADSSETSATVVNGTALKNMFGVNDYPWDFLQNPSSPNDVSHVYQAKMALIRSFNQSRLYLDWNLLEDAQGSYTYNPCNSGSWNLDAIFSGSKAAGVISLVDIKDCPEWFLQSYYPASMQDGEDVPAPYGSDLSDPASYIDQAKVAFQFAARYGSNPHVSKALLSVNAIPRWTNDPINIIKVGLGTVNYVECDNERNKWWKGPATIQTAEQYAADMSAFYDGDKGRLGKNVGVKTADPNMVVVMGGLAGGDAKWITAMINWCKQHRGYNADGSVNLCFDVINYHYYNSNSAATSGAAPELSVAAATADAVVTVAKSLKNKPQVWITESGYDINAGSPQRAPAIGNKSAELVQGDWTLRTSLLYIKHGIYRLFFYQLFDDTPNNPQQFATSGLSEGLSNRPAANYMLQVKTLMGDYVYQKTISTSPMVDVYSNGAKIIYALYMPTAKGLTSKYTLSLATSTATIYTMNPNSATISSSNVGTVNGSLQVNIGETPVFVSN